MFKSTVKLREEKQAQQKQAADAIREEALRGCIDALPATTRNKWGDGVAEWSITVEGDLITTVTLRRIAGDYTAYASHRLEESDYTSRYWKPAAKVAGQKLAKALTTSVNALELSITMPTEERRPKEYAPKEYAPTEALQLDKELMEAAKAPEELWPDDEDRKFPRWDHD